MLHLSALVCAKLSIIFQVFSSSLLRTRFLSLVIGGWSTVR